MKWAELPRTCKYYLGGIYIVSVPCAVWCFRFPATYTSLWLALTLTSLFVSTVSVRLPKISSVISIGDVFTIIALLHYGPGPALVTYWTDIVAAHVADVSRRFGLNSISKILPYRVLFNFSGCAISMYGMAKIYYWTLTSTIAPPGNQVLGLIGIAAAWFFSNTVTVSLAISFWTDRSFIGVWQEGIILYILNFVGSASVAGLVSLFYQQAGFFVLLLTLPIAVVLYQLYVFHIDKYVQSQKHIEELNRLYLQTIEAMANAVDAKDSYTHGHIRRVQAYAVTLARCVGIIEETHLMAIRAGALLHDIGKIAIPEYILNKPAVLTEPEFERMKIHPVIGGDMLKGIDFPYPVAQLVRTHHERWDGRGYPDGLKGEAIPIGARILAVADCYDALTTNRPYRTPMPRNQLVEFFQREAGRSYDPAVVTALVSNMDLLEAEAKRLADTATKTYGVQAIRQSPAYSNRPLQRLEAASAYDHAIKADLLIQGELFSAYQFAHLERSCFTTADVLLFMGAKLQQALSFDSAVFFIADLKKGTIVSEHVLGGEAEMLSSLTLLLEQKLSGWVAANNQSLNNVNPAQDFAALPEPRPAYSNACIVPLNSDGTVQGAIALYRHQRSVFTEDEFRRAEIIGSQTALALKRAVVIATPLLDVTTGIPNGSYLNLIFDNIIADANRYQYPVHLVGIQITNFMELEEQLGVDRLCAILQEFTNSVSHEILPYEVFVRYSIECFLLLVATCETDESGDRFAAKYRAIVGHSTTWIQSRTNVRIVTNLVQASYPEDAADLRGLVDIVKGQERHHVVSS